MLVEFTVKNYRSIKDEMVFNLAKDKGNELAKSNSFAPNAPASVPLLRSAAIYGANAAGKSNLIKAMKVMNSIVRLSANASQEGDELSVTPFLFDECSSDEPTEFEMVFISEEVRYQYGFAATKQHIVEEWSFAFPKSRPQRWFSRGYDSKTNSSSYKFGDSLTGPKTVWQNATRSNALFLSTAVQLNAEPFKPIFNWFKDKLKLANVSGWRPSFTAKICEDEAIKNKVLSFLQAADFNIHNIDIGEKKFGPAKLSDEIPDVLKEKMVETLKDKVLVDIKTIHKTKAGQLVPLDFDEESDGTRKFFSFIGPWIDSLRKGNILVIDELHDNLHPKMVKYLVELFHSNNPNNAQLIFTTHDTSILNQEVFRRDQIWFCEKNNEQATNLYPLTDFSPRKDHENLELGYLAGRYGALPFVKSFDLGINE